MLNDIIHTYGSKILLIVLGLVSNIIITRSLGVAEYGSFVFVMTVVTMGMQLGSFGLHSANIYYAAQSSRFTGMLLNNSLIFSLFSGIVTIITMTAVYIFIPAIFGIDKVFFVFAMVMIPFSLGSLYIRNILIGIGKIKIDNTITVYSKLLLIGLLLIFAYFYTLNVFNALLIAFVTLVFGIYMALKELRSNISYLNKPSLRLFKKISGFGLKAYLSGLLSYLVFKSDLFFVNYYLSKHELSNYALAVSFTDYIYILPVTVGTILFQKLSSMRDKKQKYELMHKMTLLFSGIYLVFLLCVYFLSDFLITTIYGMEFKDSVVLVNLLLIAIFFIGVETVQVQYLNSFGFPQEIVYYWLGAFLINILLNFIFISQYGLFAIIISTIISYLFIFLVVVSRIQNVKYK